MSSSHTSKPKSGTIFYGWYALAGAALVIFVTGGIYCHSFSVFLPVISDDFGWSRGTVSLALSISVAAFGLPSPLFGLFVARFGPRKAIIWGNLTASFAIASLAFVQEIWQLYALYVIVGLGTGFGGYVACTSLVANWFVKKRPLALGIFTASGGLGGFVFPPLATALIEATGWRLSWATLAALMALIGSILAGVVLSRNKPEEMGLYPDGRPPTPMTEHEASLTSSLAMEKTAGISMRNLLRQRKVWLMGGFASANSLILGIMLTHQVSHFQDIGYTPMGAATIASLFSIMSCIGSLIFGVLALKMNVRLLGITFFIFQLGAILILLTSTDPGLVHLYAILIGIGNGALMAAMPTFAGFYYHGDHYAKAMGIIMTFQVMAQSVSTAIAGWMFDLSGNYTSAFYMVAICAVMGAVFVFFSANPGQSKPRPAK